MGECVCLHARLLVCARACEEYVIVYVSFGSLTKTRRMKVHRKLLVYVYNKLSILDLNDSLDKLFSIITVKTLPVDVMIVILLTGCVAVLTSFLHEISESHNPVLLFFVTVLNKLCETAV